jgi:heme exporter protein C
MIQKTWWKILAVVLLLYAFIGGLLLPVPRLPIVNESIRNLYYHVPMWFGMMVIMTVSVVNAIRYLSSKNLLYDIRSGAYANTGIILGILGLVTGAIWANYAWGAPWSNDIKQILAAIALLIYLAYFVLRSSIDDMDKKARVSAVYNIFAYAMLFPTLFILPRLYDSLHPGGEGNPALSQQDIDPTMRMVFWPAVLGWTLLSVWITTLFVRYRRILDKNILHA